MHLWCDDSDGLATWWSGDRSGNAAHDHRDLPAVIATVTRYLQQHVLYRRFEREFTAVVQATSRYSCRPRATEASVGIRVFGIREARCARGRFRPGNLPRELQQHRAQMLSVS